VNAPISLKPSVTWLLGQAIGRELNHGADLLMGFGSAGIALAGIESNQS
jgi:hypothetical protein